MEDGPYRNTRSSSTGNEKTVSDILQDTTTPKLDKTAASKHSEKENNNSKLRTPSGQILKPIRDIRNFFSSIGGAEGDLSTPQKSKKRRSRKNSQTGKWVEVKARERK